MPTAESKKAFAPGRAEIKCLNSETTRSKNRKEILELLTNTCQHCESIINFLPDPTFLINTEGEVIAWNHAMETLSGIAAEKIIGQGDYIYAVPYYGKRRPIMIDLVLNPDLEIEHYYPFITKENETLISEIYCPAIEKYLWVKASPLYDNFGEKIGAIEVTRDITELKDSERNLKAMNDHLQEQSTALNEKNIALKEIMTHIEEEKLQITRQLQSNIDRVVMPIIKSLRMRVNEEDRTYFALLENSLRDITSPFINKLELKYSRLSPREIEICNMLKSGQSSKDIADSLNVSIHTVLKQRQRIRKKFEITNEDTNLTTYLKTI